MNRFLILTAGASLFAIGACSPTSPDELGEGGDIEEACEGEQDVWPVTLSEVEQAYESNEAAAQRDYGDRFLAVTGTVDRIDLDLDDQPVVFFNSDLWPAPSARFCPQYEMQAADLAKDQEVTLGCASVSEAMGIPRFASCQVLPEGWAD